MKTFPIAYILVIRPRIHDQNEYGSALGFSRIKSCRGYQWKIPGGRVKFVGIPGGKPKIEKKTWISRGSRLI